MMDKILYCYTPDTRWNDQLETREFLQTCKYSSIVERINVSKDLKAYPLALIDNIGKCSFINIEMDIVPTNDILTEMAICEHPLCVAQYTNNVTYNFSEKRLCELVDSYCKGTGVDRKSLTKESVTALESMFKNNRFSPLILHRRLAKQNIEMDFSGNYLDKPLEKIIKTNVALNWVDFNDDYCEIPGLGIIKFNKSITIEEPDLSMMKSVSDWHHFDGTLGKYFLKKGIKAHVHKYMVKHNHYFVAGDDGKPLSIC